MVIVFASQVGDREVAEVGVDKHVTLNDIAVFFMPVRFILVDEIDCFSLCQIKTLKRDIFQQSCLL